MSLDARSLLPDPQRPDRSRQAFAPIEAVREGEWTTPATFNFTRDVVERLAELPLSHPALTFIDTDGVIDRLTFSEVAARAARWAGLMRDQGVEPGDRVLVVVGRRPAWHEVLLATLKIGAVAVPCSPDLQADELAFRLRDSEAVLVVADGNVTRRLRGVEDAPSVLSVDDVAADLARQLAVAPTHEGPVDEPAFILYTSGTTGRPKGVVHTHAYCHATAMQAQHWLGVGPEDRVWCTGDVGWAKSIWNVLLGPWSQGAEIVVDGRPFDALDRVELIERLQVTILCQTPADYRQLAELGDLRASLAGLRRAVSGGDRLGADVLEAFREASGHTVHDGYGQTETTLLVGRLVRGDTRDGSLGSVTPGHVVALIDHHGREVEAGEEGDIAVFGRPPGLFAGYWNDPDATLAAFRGDWYVTGDRAVRDEDGSFWLTGRATDVLVTGAGRVGPLAVEQVLLEEVALAEAAVVLVPGSDDRLALKAFVVLEPRRRRTDALVGRLCAQVERSVPGCVLSDVEFVAELPRTANGKVRRAELRNREFERLGLPVPDAPVEPAEESEEEALQLGETALIVAALGLRDQERLAEERRREQEQRDADEAEAAAEEQRAARRGRRPVQRPRRA